MTRVYIVKHVISGVILDVFRTNESAGKLWDKKNTIYAGRNTHKIERRKVKR